MNKSKGKSKKSEKANASKDEAKIHENKMNTSGGGESPSQTTPGAGTPAPPPGGSGAPSGMSKPTSWFATEIQQMMHGFGDCRKPLPESAALIEEIVHQQMSTLMIQASDVAVMRGVRFVGIEDLLFLLRRDKTKLRRLIKYMTLKDRCPLRKGVEEEVEMQDAGADGKQQPVRKKKKICYDFLASIDQTGELLALFDEDGTDEVKMERALRAELQTRHMDAQQYMDYCEARQTSFTPRWKSPKFKDWMQAGVVVDLKPNPLAMEVLSYFAYETVAQIMDLALLVRRDTSGTVGDPFLSAMPPVCLTHESPSGPNPAKSPPRPGSPSMTPPSTPTTPSPAGGSANAPVPVPSPAAASSVSKPKSKKRKKSGSQIPRDSYQQALQPSDVREALRRFSQSTGPFADFSKSPMICPKTKLLAC